MEEYDAGFTVGSIDNDIVISAVVPVVQPDSRFGRLNSKLVGDAVSSNGNRVVSDTVITNFPLDWMPVNDGSKLRTRFMSGASTAAIDKDAPTQHGRKQKRNGSVFAIGSTGCYIAVSLYPPNHELAKVQQLRELPPMGRLRNLASVDQPTDKWHEVEAIHLEGRKIWSGWISQRAMDEQKFYTVVQ